MFQLLIKGFAAWNQLILFTMALFCAALGALILGSAAYWTIRGLRVQGRIIGVRQSKGLFHTVYRYALPSGQSYEATSRNGSSRLTGRTTGASVPLLVIPGHYGQVEEARSHLWTLVGVVCLAIATWLLNVALHLSPLGPMTGIVAGVAAAMIGVRIYRAARAPALRRGGDSRQAAGAPDDDSMMNSLPVQRSEDLLAQPERRASAAQARVSQRRSAPVMLVIGALLLVWGCVLGRAAAQLQLFGQRTPGMVQSLERSTAGGSDTSLFPVVSFTLADGTSVRFRDSSGSSPPAYRIGDRVTVLYLPDDARSATIDRGAWNWLLPALVLLGGALLMLLSVRLWRSADTGA